LIQEYDYQALGNFSNMNKVYCEKNQSYYWNRKETVFSMVLHIQEWF